MGQSSTLGFVTSAPFAGVLMALLCLLSYLVTTPSALAQTQNGITDPEDGADLSGIVTIRGTATHEQFLRYEVAFSNGGDWLVFAEGDRPVVDGTLAIWDTTVGQPLNPVFPDGGYRLRLRVVRQDYNYDEYFVNNLRLNNALTPTPSATATPEVNATTTIGTPGPQASPTSGFIIIRPTPLPSLTPFPSPSSPAIPGAVQGTPRPPGSAPPSNSGGLLQRLLAIETNAIGRAFWGGVQLSLLLFTLLALYVLMRALVRFIWPRLWAWMNRQE